MASTMRQSLDLGEEEEQERLLAGHAGQHAGAGGRNSLGYFAAAQAAGGGATHFIGLNGAPDVIHLDSTPSVAGTDRLVPYEAGPDR